MVIRNCSGGIVFCGDSVLLIRNDKHEWSFPKGVVRSDSQLKDVAVERVKLETSVDAKVIAPCGKTSYEFYSVTRRKPVHNNVSWFVMASDSDDASANEAEKIVEAVFVPVKSALKTITYSQDKSLLMVAYQKYKETVG